MTLRTGHGTGKGQPRVEVLPADELPAGVPAPTRPAAARDESGRFLPGAGTKELARKGAEAKHEAAQIARLSGLWEAPDGHIYQPYQRLALEWREKHLSELASTVGGGRVGPGPASVVASASLQLAASRFLYDLAADIADAKMLLEASRLADASRQNLLAAHELAAKEAQSRPKNSAHAALEAAFGGDS